MSNTKSGWKKLTSMRLFLPIVCLIAVLLVNVITTPGFFKVSIKNGVPYGYPVDVINRASELVILSVGMTLVTAASGGQDISVGAVMAVAGAVCCQILSGGEVSVNSLSAPIIVAFLAALVASGICGAFNGFLVAKLNIQPMVATLILYTAGRGIAQLVTNGQITYIRVDSFKMAGGYIGKSGLYPVASGSVTYYNPDNDQPKELVGLSPMAIRKSGIAMSFVPEDRLGMGLVGSMGMTDNMMLKSYGKGHSPIVDRKAPLALAETIKKELGVVTPDLNTPVSRLSGGNVQKVLVGRELAADPIVLMTAYAVRGLDINTSYTIYHLLNEQKKRGVAVIYVGEDLDVLLELCDRIVVLCGGKVNGILDGRKTTKEEVGLRMTNLVKEEQA